MPACPAVGRAGPFYRAVGWTQQGWCVTPDGLGSKCRGGFKRKASVFGREQGPLANRPQTSRPGLPLCGAGTPIVPTPTPRFLMPQVWAGPRQNLHF